jgi:excisionase family DNA binding protein
LRTALAKRAAGVPTYSVPEAAALLSISQEYLYRLIQAGGFPAVRMRLGRSQGRYVVPAKAVERLLDDTTAAGASVEVTDWSAAWRATTSGGVA